MVLYFGYGSNMSKKVLEGVRNIHPKRSQSAILKSYKIIINMPGPNFIEPGFANILPMKGKNVEGVLHEISETDLARIVASEGEDYKLVKVKIKFFGKLVEAQTLVFKSSLQTDLPTSKRYKKILINAALDNALSEEYVNELRDKQAVYYPLLSEYYAVMVYFWVKKRAN